MNPSTIAIEVATVLGALPGIRSAFGHPVKSVGGARAVIVGYGRTMYGIESTGGADRITYPLWVVLGDVVAAETAEKVGGYAGRGDPRSVVDALQNHAWTSCDYVHVVSQDLDVVAIGDKDHLAVTFEIDVVASND